jgi:hypothetical protein
MVAQALSQAVMMSHGCSSSESGSHDEYRMWSGQVIDHIRFESCGYAAL